MVDPNTPEEESTGLERAPTSQDQTPGAEPDVPLLEQRTTSRRGFLKAIGLGAAAVSVPGCGGCGNKKNASQDKFAPQEEGDTGPDVRNMEKFNKLKADEQEKIMKGKPPQFFDDQWVEMGRDEREKWRKSLQEQVADDRVDSEGRPLEQNDEQDGTGATGLMPAGKNEFLRLTDVGVLPTIQALGWACERIASSKTTGKKGNTLHVEVDPPNNPAKPPSGIGLETDKVSGEQRWIRKVQLKNVSIAGKSPEYLHRIKLAAQEARSRIQEANDTIESWESGGRVSLSTIAIAFDVGEALFSNWQRLFGNAVGIGAGWLVNYIRSKAGHKLDVDKDMPNVKKALRRLDLSVAKIDAALPSAEKREEKASKNEAEDKADTKETDKQTREDEREAAKQAREDKLAAEQRERDEKQRKADRARETREANKKRDHEQQEKAAQRAHEADIKQRELDARGPKIVLPTDPGFKKG